MSVLLCLLESMDKVNFEKIGNNTYVGYKVMKVDDAGEFVSNANSRLTLPSKVGDINKMPGEGIFMSNDPEYVVDYYSYKEDEEDPDECVIKYAFKLSDVVRGTESLGDSEPEIGVRVAKIVAKIPIDDWQQGKRFQ